MCDEPTFGERLMASMEGICPTCREHKFIGHGPLCTDCYLAAADRA